MSAAMAQKNRGQELAIMREEVLAYMSSYAERHRKKDGGKRS